MTGPHAKIPGAMGDIAHQEKFTFLSVATRRNVFETIRELQEKGNLPVATSLAVSGARNLVGRGGVRDLSSYEVRQAKGSRKNNISARCGR
jgi:hypothetical protein